MKKLTTKTVKFVKINIFSHNLKICTALSIYLTRICGFKKMLNFFFSRSNSSEDEEKFIKLGINAS